MGIGVSIFLIVAGAIIYFALDFNISGVEDSTLGIILMVAGVLGIILALVMNQQRTRTTHVEERRRYEP